MKTIIAVLIIYLSMQGYTHAADRSGNYAIWGKGNKSCFSYLKDRDAGKDNAYKNYVMGYLTAYNTLTPETYNISGNLRLDDIMAWLDDYCDAKQVHGLEQSLIEFISEHHEKRLRTLPGRIGR